MTDPRFTVLMPTHNRADVVGLAIRSVLNQTLGDFELLVVGDGCTDDTAAVVQGFGDPRVVWMDLPKAPYFGYANRNQAMSRARGRLIAYCAHDDLLFPDHLALLFETMERGDNAFAYSQPLWVSSDGVLAPSPGDLRHSDLYLDFQAENYIPLSSIAHTRALFDAVGGWPEAIAAAADWSMWKAMLARAWPLAVAYLPIPTMAHFVAIWKTRRDSNLPMFKVALDLADRVSWWPRALRLPAPGAGATLQHAMAAQLAQPAYVEAVRAGCASFVDRLAAELLRNCLPPGRDAIRRAHAASLQSARLAPPEPASLRALANDLIARAERLECGLAPGADAHPHAASFDAPADAELVRLSGLFDPEWYLAMNPDVAGSGDNPLWHYLQHGWRENRQPGPLFDARLYLKRRPDLGERRINPLVHYLKGDAASEQLLGGPSLPTA
jgi:hypothetical protein